VSRFYILRARRIVIERLAYLSYADLQYGIAYVGLRPDGVEQIVFSHQLAGALGQVLQDGERLGPERDLLLISIQALAGRAESEWREYDLLVWSHDNYREGKMNGQKRVYSNCRAGCKERRRRAFLNSGFRGFEKPPNVVEL
jgi:hypothetical protein